MLCWLMVEGWCECEAFWAEEASTASSGLAIRKPPRACERLRSPFMVQLPELGAKLLCERAECQVADRRGARRSCNKEKTGTAVNCRDTE